MEDDDAGRGLIQVQVIVVMCGLHDALCGVHVGHMMHCVGYMWIT